MPDPISPSALSAIPPPVTPDRSKLVMRGRVRGASDVLAAFQTMWTADLWRSRNRALCQSSIDGASPYSLAQDQRSGNYGRSNFNPGITWRSTFREQAPYNDLLEEMDTLITFPTKFGDDMTRSNWEPILAEGFTKMLRRWPMFNYLWQYNVSLFVREGVSVCYFEDEDDWQWQVAGLQYFKFENQCVPCEDKLDMCGCRMRMNCAELYRKIANPKVAAKVGWNVEAVKAVIKQATQLTETSADIERWEARWKNMEALDGSRAPQVEVVHLFVQELDGTVTHIIAPRDDQTGGNKGAVLYEKKGKFRSMSRLLTLFTYGVGTNGDLHSIRGHTSRIFNAATAATRTLNAFVDMAIFSATPHMEVANEDAMQSLPFRKVGFMNIVQTGNKFMEVKTPPFEQTLTPLYSTMMQLFEGESSGASLQPQARMERKTNLQENNERLAEGQLTSSAMNLFFPALERLFKEVARRVIRRNYREDEPGGKEVWWLRNYLMRNNVPLDALYEADIDSMEINTGIGRGSQAARRAVVASLMQDYYLFDPEAQNRVLHLKVATEAGARTANMIVPIQPGLRPGQHVENAMLQNGLLTGNNPAQIASVKPLPDQDSAAHVQTHLDFLSELWPMTQEQDQKAALAAIQPLWSHAIEDWRMMDPQNPFYKQAKEALTQQGEWVVNTAKEIAAAEDREGDQAAQESGAPSGVGEQGPSMSNYARSIDANAKLQIDSQRYQMKLNYEQQMLTLKKAEAIQRMQLNNLEAATRRGSPAAA